MEDRQSLKRRTATSIAWSICRVGSDQVFNFIVFAILARILAPSEFGVFILALGVAELGKVIAQGGLTTVLFRHRDISRELADTVFWSNFVVALILCGVVFVFRHTISMAFDAAAAAPVIAAIGFTIPIAAAGASHMARNLRDFGHRALAVRSVLSGLVGGGVAVVMAMNGWGVWALVAQRIVTETIGTLTAWWSFPWMPSLGFSWRMLRQQMPLAGSIMTSQLLLAGLGRMQDVIISRMIGLHALGVYRNAWKTTELISQGVIVPFVTVSASTLLRLTQDEAGFRRAYLRLIEASAFLSFPAILGAGAIAGVLVPLIYGPQWYESIMIAQILSLLVLPFAINFFAEPGLQVLGKSRFITLLAMVQVGSTALFCIVAAQFGLVYFTIAYVTRAYLTMFLQMVIFEHQAHVPMPAIARVIAPPLFAASAMAATLYALQAWYPLATGPGSLELFRRASFLVLSGAALYGVLLSIVVGPSKRKKAFGYMGQISYRLRRL